MSLSTATVPFGGVPITTTSIPISFTLSNVGTAPLAVTSIAINGANAADFALSPASTCPLLPAILAVNTNCTTSMRFTPSASGARSASVIITDNHQGSPTFITTQAVSLTGTGTDFSLSASPASITIPAGKMATYTITLTPVQGFNNPVAYTCAGGPTHSNCFISGVSNGSATIILATSQGVNHGTFPVTFKATYTGVAPATGTLAHSATASLTIK